MLDAVCCASTAGVLVLSHPGVVTLHASLASCYFTTACRQALKVCALVPSAGFCQMVVERAQFLDMNMESAQVMTVLGASLAESGALKRADMLLRQALEFFWRELKGPHPAVARCYRVRSQGLHQVAVWFLLLVSTFSTFLSSIMQYDAPQPVSDTFVMCAPVVRCRSWVLCCSKQARQLKPHHSCSPAWRCRSNCLVG